MEPGNGRPTRREQELTSKGMLTRMGGRTGQTIRQTANPVDATDHPALTALFVSGIGQNDSDLGTRTMPLRRHTAL